MWHERVFFPVGQGGFAVERIGDYIVAFDCGSSTSLGLVESWIDLLTRHYVNRIDVLFISHFDNDHVNSIRYLLNNVKVVRTVTSMIPEELKTAYSIYTNGAYNAIMTLLRENNMETDEVGGEENEILSIQHNDIWEWVAKSMMSVAEFERIKAKMVEMGLDVTRLDEAEYLEKEKKNVNKAFRAVFGTKGPNAKGLIMLSQKSKNVPVSGCEVVEGWRLNPTRRGVFKESSCLYVGDADLRNVANKADVKSFIRNKKTEDELLLMQIPHHGSQNNRGVGFETDFPARLYFVNDVDTNRLQKNSGLLNSLTRQRKLLVLSDRVRDIMMGFTKI